MRIYHASLWLSVLLKHHELFPDKKLNILRSFGVPSKENEGFLITHRDKTDSIILDSGTYSLNNQRSQDGMTISLEGYKDYLLSFAHYFDFCFNFDSNFTEEGFETNIYNQKRLEDAGLNPVPVVHDIDGEEIDLYIEQNRYPIVAVGSRQVTSLESLYPVVERLYDAGIKIHLFGTSKFEFISSLPIYSCDTTSWALSGGYGRVNYWNPVKEGKDKTERFPLEDFIVPGDKRKLGVREKLDRYLDQTFGLTYEDLFGYEAYFNRMIVNTHYYVQIEGVVNQIHREKGFSTFP